MKINHPTTIPSNAITINPGNSRNPVPANSLQFTQKELFEKLLTKNQKLINSQDFNPNDIQMIPNENNSLININNEILANAGLTIGNSNDYNNGSPKNSNSNNLLQMLNPVGTMMGKQESNQQQQQSNMINYNYTPGINPNIINTLNDSSKIKRKIYVPQNQTFNYTGLIIGPKGANQKRLEEETGCKILVRGKGSQKEGQPPQPDDNEPQHVLIVGDNPMQVAKAVEEIERIMLADEETRNKIRQEQLKLVAQLKNDPSSMTGGSLQAVLSGKVDLSLTTPYGPPAPDAVIIPVPNDCVGLVIGKGGETIKLLQAQSGARKVQVAADSAPNSNYRNVFVEGEQDSVEKVKKMIGDILESHQKLKQAMTGMQPGSQKTYKLEYPVPNNIVGLIIGRGGETIKGINQRHGAFVFIPKECEPGKNERVLIISGTDEQAVTQAKQEIEDIVNMGQKNMALKTAQSLPIIGNSGTSQPTLPINPLLMQSSSSNSYEKGFQYSNQNNQDQNNMNQMGLSDPQNQQQQMQSQSLMMNQNDPMFLNSLLNPLDPAYYAMINHLYQAQQTTIVTETLIPSERTYQNSSKNLN